MSTRAAILERIRARLGAGPRASEAAALPLAFVSIPPEERVERFGATLERVGGTVHLARGEREAADRVAALLAGADARRLIVSDDARAAALAATLPPGIMRLAPSAPRAELLEAEAGLTGAQWGIAETGTLVLESAREKHRLASLLPPLHVALLPVERLLGTLGEALSALQGSDGRPSSRTITLVTGPSRTADIELELVVGVHGPRQLHVVLLGTARA